jgi:hypothetical protein
MRVPIVLASAVLGALLGTAPPPVLAQSLGAQCRAACDAKSIPASCRWLAEKPRRCIRHAIKECKRNARAGLPIVCPLPQDLPGCLTNHSCPFGALCIDNICQVVACGGAADPPCTLAHGCDDGKCVVTQCAGATENCPVGFHCGEVSGPLGSTCSPDDPNVSYCTADTDCITPGEFNRVCRSGTCERRNRRRAGSRPTTTSTTTSSTPISSTTSTTNPYGGACFDVFDCRGAAVCCAAQCRADPYAGKGICSSLYTPACTLCTTDDDCGCNGIFCDVCEGSASLNGCLDPCL